MVCFSITSDASTWSGVFTDNFSRADSPSPGNSWSDPAGVGSLSNNTLILTTPAGENGTNIRVSRPDSEASLNQRIEATFTLPATNDGLSHSAYVRGKSLVIAGREIYPVMLISVRHSGALSMLLSYKGGAGLYTQLTGSAGFTPVMGRSYTLAVQIQDNFPSVLAATLTDNSTTTEVASVTYSDSAQYSTSGHMSPDFKTAGVMGLAMEGAAGKSVSFSRVVTYGWNETGAFSVPAMPLFRQHDRKTYLASASPTGGTPPYRIRWYRGTSSTFTPPATSDGTGNGAGTYLGDTFEQVDTNAPAGISNWTIYYRAVYFDSGANATTGLLGIVRNANSPSLQSYAIPLWIGDSITAGYATSANNISKSPATYAQTYLAADSAVAAAFTMPILGGQNNIGMSGKTTSDMVLKLAYIVGQARLIGATFVGIMLGTNDSKNSVATPSAQYKGNIQTIIAALKAVRPDMKIVLNKPLWFKPDTGYGSDFSTASLARLAQYHSMLDQLADGTSIVVGSMAASDEIRTYGWTGTMGSQNVANTITNYPPAPTGGKSYLVDGLHPYDGGSEMIAKLEWGPNAKNALFGNFTPVTPKASSLCIMVSGYTRIPYNRINL